MPDPISLPALAPIATVVVLLEVAAGTTVAAYTVDSRQGRARVRRHTSLICAGLMALDLLIEALLPSGTRAARARRCRRRTGVAVPLVDRLHGRAARATRSSAR